MHPRDLANIHHLGSGFHAGPLLVAGHRVLATDASPGSWRRDDERHENVVVDTAEMPARLGVLGVDATVTPAFGDERSVEGLVAMVGRRR